MPTDAAQERSTPSWVLNAVVRFALALCAVCNNASGTLASPQEVAEQEIAEPEVAEPVDESPTSFLDIQAQHVRFEVDTQNQRLLVQVSVNLRLPPAADGPSNGGESSGREDSTAYALFDLVPSARRFRIGQSGAWIDGDFPTRRIDRITWRTLPHKLDVGKQYTLQAEYELTPANTPRCRFECSVIPAGSTRRLISAVQFFRAQEIAPPASRSLLPADGVDFLMAVMDYDPNTYRTDGRTFLERYVPSSLESDQFALTIDVDLLSRGTNGSRPHRVMANGHVQETQRGWRVGYPESSTCSSVYFHLIPEDRYYVSSSTATLQKQEIPVTVYSTRAAGSQFHDGIKDRPREYLELFGDQIGFYPHAAFVAHLFPRSGGMEYSGATSCSPSALKHEVMHSWFGRGAHPADGNAGWIDEAITYWWVDRGSPTTTPPPEVSELQRPQPGALAHRGEYRRMTPSAAYRQGGKFIGFVASVFKQHGVDMKEVLVEFAKQHLHGTYSNEQFLDHLRNSSPPEVDLQPAIDILVFGEKPSNAAASTSPDD